ncbi:TPA: P-type conjugative transfer protein TrbL [Xanthomonas vasicola pv. zeae]|uniref:P-type conjugative transfer protein TrbL n=3 Tax=Xanthomonas vasicola TaxID=56459 RepID=A0AAE8F981_XANVA|nr:P-type conjugative transfer protein TrbL [Xanthomonas vasicola]AVQ07033.1 P-type conjugative transfer protein TrbL [Xanthomonas vasicola pv. vasculorum]AZM71235.1 P-type conjugative transfer protein TrbL [Xanthomonas vasicola pv. vasculorum]KFA28894.1 conjugal transfer protein TrbL [Xanthomonas vasicola pv. vasculorum NCPPB 1381]KFA29799.1 conjugal transfer protein TrbL [Xanthomonas vasicola pv. vasculorum NCPPB 1326]MBV6747394.1 P-type conjugative transfer protein TrbL [Xanthomonas vasicol
MKALHKAALIGVTLAFYSTAASAQLTNQGMLDQVVTEFATRATSWQTVVMNAAMFLFWTLGTISLVFTFGFMALRKADIGEFFAEFIRFILFFGFFLWLLRNGPAFANSIIQSLARIGEQASGVASVTPSGIVDIGFMILKQAFTNSSIWSPVDNFIGVALSIGILILLAVVAVNMLLLLVSGWLLMYAGIFFLGFGGSRWTSDMAINYYKTVLGVAVQIMTMVLLVGIGNDLLSSFYARMNTGTLNFEELGVMLVFCVALLMLVNRVPPLIAGIISGTGIGNAGGIGNFGAGAAVGAAMGAASVAAGAASMAGAAVMSGAANFAGGASAVKAAFEKAQGSATSDAGAGMDMMASMGGANTSSGQDSAGAGASPFAQAAGFGGSASGGGSTSTGSSSGSPKGGGKADVGGQGSSSTASTGNGADTAAKNEPKPAGGAGQGQQGGQQAAPGSTGPGGFTRAAALVASTAGELAKGAGTVLKGKAVQLAEGFQERMDETIGGQVATAIRAGTAAEPPAFDGNSLAGNQAADPDDEVAAFVNRSTPA